MAVAAVALAINSAAEAVAPAAVAVLLPLAVADPAVAASAVACEAVAAVLASASPRGCLLAAPGGRHPAGRAFHQALGGPSPDGLRDSREGIHSPRGAGRVAPAAVHVLLLDSLRESRRHLSTVLLVGHRALLAVVRLRGCLKIMGGLVADGSVPPVVVYPPPESRPRAAGHVTIVTPCLAG